VHADVALVAEDLTVRQLDADLTHALGLVQLGLEGDALHGLDQGLEAGGRHEVESFLRRHEQVRGLHLLLELGHGATGALGPGCDDLVASGALGGELAYHLVVGAGQGLLQALVGVDAHEDAVHDLAGDLAGPADHVSVLLLPQLQQVGVPGADRGLGVVVGHEGGQHFRLGAGALHDDVGQLHLGELEAARHEVLRDRVLDDGDLAPLHVGHGLARLGDDPVVVGGVVLDDDELDVNPAEGRRDVGVDVRDGHGVVLAETELRDGLGIVHRLGEPDGDAVLLRPLGHQVLKQERREVPGDVVTEGHVEHVLRLGRGLCLGARAGHGHGDRDQREHDGHEELRELLHLSVSFIFPLRNLLRNAGGESLRPTAGMLS